jgi:hypothetical protein
VVVGALLAVAALVPSGTHTPAEFLLYAGINLGELAATLLFALYFARGNYLAWLLTAWALALVPRCADLLSQPYPALHEQGWLVIVLLAATLIWATAPALLHPKPITLAVRDTP